MGWNLPTISRADFSWNRLGTWSEDQLAKHWNIGSRP